MQAVICEVFKNTAKEGMYLYVAKSSGVKDVPEALLGMMKLQSVMTLLIRPEVNIANVTGEKVLGSIVEKGFYLQMPEQADDYMQELADKNNKLPKQV